MKCRIKASCKYADRTPYKLIKRLFGTIKCTEDNYIKLKLRDRSPIVDIDISINSFEYFCEAFIRSKLFMDDSVYEKRCLSNLFSSLFYSLLRQEGEKFTCKDNCYTLQTIVSDYEGMDKWVIYPIKASVYENTGTPSIFKKGGLISSGPILFDYTRKRLAIETDYGSRVKLHSLVSEDDALYILVDYNNGTMMNGQQCIMTVDNKTYCLVVTDRRQ